MKSYKIVLSWMTLAVLSGIPAVANSATYYVAKTGSNSNTCAVTQSPSTPKLTIAGGLACMGPGDTVIVKNGTYAESINHDQLVSGTASAYTTIKAENVGEVTLVPPSTGSASTDFGVWFYGKRFINFDGFVIDGSNLLSFGILINTTSNTKVPSSFITLSNLEVKDVPMASCLMITGTPSSGNVTVRNSKFHHCGLKQMIGAKPTLVPLWHGLYIAGHSNLVERNEIYNNAGHGYHQARQSNSDQHNNIARYNFIHHNGSRCAIIGSGDNNVFDHNICANNDKDGIAIASGSPDNNQVYNNTFYNNGGRCIQISGTNNKVRNNLCLSNGQNVILKLKDSSGTIDENNRLSTDLTLVVDASKNQFAPRDNSPLIAAGQGAVQRHLP
jgi:parallel beta-helix repeat protein